MSPQVLHSYGYGLPVHYYIYGGLCGGATLGLVLAVVAAIVVASTKREEK